MSFITRNSLLQNKKSHQDAIPTNSMESNCSKTPTKSFKNQRHQSLIESNSEFPSGKRTNSLTRRSIKIPECITKSQFCPALLRTHSYHSNNQSQIESPPQQQQQQRNRKQRNSLSYRSNYRPSPTVTPIHFAKVSVPTKPTSFSTADSPAASHERQQPPQFDPFDDNNNNYQTINNSTNSTEDYQTKQNSCSQNTKKHSNMQIPEREYENIRTAFDSVDEDNDGKITPNELYAAFLKLGNVVTESYIMQMINKVDIDCNGTVEFNEFLIMMQNYTQMKKEQRANDSEDSDIYDAFKAFDHNCDGFIDSDEIKRTMVALGETVTDSDVSAMISEADVDQDGRIDYDEFKKIMKIFKRKAAQK